MRAPLPSANSKGVNDIALPIQRYSSISLLYRAVKAPARAARREVTFCALGARDVVGPPREPNLTVRGNGCRSSQGQSRKMGVSGVSAEGLPAIVNLLVQISHVSQCADRTTVA